MNLLISASDLKTFYSALQCLGRFSDTFWLQCVSKANGQAQICLSAINPTNSAFCKFTFDPDFFLSVSTASSSQIECQIQLKVVLSILRARGRTVERCELELIDEGDECRFSIKLHCQHGILKVHKLTYEPKKPLSPADGPEAPNMFSINAQTAQEWTEHFLSSTKNGDITFYCTPESCTAKSKEDDIAEGKGQIRKAIHTEVKIAMENFRDYRVVSSSLLTFSLKEFKATVTLAETLQTPLEIRFSDGNEPLFLRLKVESAIEASFVVATSKDDKMSSHSGPPASSRPTNERPTTQAIAVSRSGTASRESATAQKRRQDSLTQTQDQSHSRTSGTRESSSAYGAHPIQSTPRPADHAAVENDTDEEETAPLFFPGASQTSQLDLRTAEGDTYDFSMQNVERVPPTPLSKGGDPQEFASAALASQTTASQASDTELNLEQVGPRKRFQPLF